MAHHTLEPDEVVVLRSRDLIARSRELLEQTEPLISWPYRVAPSPKDYIGPDPQLSEPRPYPGSHAYRPLRAWS
jgi:hypothetical protein